MNKLSVAILSLSLLTSSVASAGGDARCPSHEPFSQAINNLCWDCIFPIYVAGVKIDASSSKKDKDDSGKDKQGTENGTGNSGAGTGTDKQDSGKEDVKNRTGNFAVFHNPGVPADAYTKPLCSCREGKIDKPGLSESLWEPARLVEATFMAGCMPALGGAVTGLGPGGNGVSSHSGTVRFDGEHDYRNVHMYAFPLLRILNMSTSAVCVKDGYQDISLMELSELNPFYKDSSLSMVATPEAVIVSAMSVLAPIACLAETPKTMTNNSPIESLWWCAGNWGIYYPLVGTVNGDNSFRATSLEATRILALMHRSGREFNTVGKANMCSAGVSEKLPKQQWKMQQYFPVPENGSHVIGYPTILWDHAKHYPGIKGQTDGYVLFRWNDCCNHME